MSVWLSTADLLHPLQPQPSVHFTPGCQISNSGLSISINQSLQYQTLDGFGASLTEGSAWLLSQMDKSSRNELFQVRIALITSRCFALPERIAPFGASY